MGWQKTSGGGVQRSRPLPSISHSASVQGNSTWLVAPGPAPGRFAIARSGADVALLDLEETVPRLGPKSRNLTYVDRSSQGSRSAPMRRAGSTRCPDPIAQVRRPAGLAQLVNWPSVRESRG